MERDCKFIISRIDRYLSGRLGPQEAGQLEHHLRQCAECAARVEAAGQEEKVLRAALRPFAARPDLAGRIMRQVEALPAPVAASRQLAMPRWALATAAAMLALALLAGWPRQAPISTSNVAVAPVKPPDAANPALDIASPVAPVAPVVPVAVATVPAVSSAGSRQASGVRNHGSRSTSRAPAAPSGIDPVEVAMNMTEFSNTTTEAANQVDAGEEYENRGMYERALTAYGEAEPSPTVHLARGRVYERMGDMGNAVYAYADVAFGSL